MKRSMQRGKISQKIMWTSVGIFAISGILPWFVVKFPIGNLKISIFDLILYFTDNQGIEIDFYSTFIYSILLGGWVFTLFLLIATASINKSKLTLITSIIVIVAPLTWIFVAPYLRVQMIFLSLSNQPIAADQTMGSGEIAAVIAGCVTIYSFIRSKL